VTAVAVVNRSVAGVRLLRADRVAAAADNRTGSLTTLTGFL